MCDVPQHILASIVLHGQPHHVPHTLIASCPCYTSQLTFSTSVTHNSSSVIRLLTKKKKIDMHLVILTLLLFTGTTPSNLPSRYPCIHQTLKLWDACLPMKWWAKHKRIRHHSPVLSNEDCRKTSSASFAAQPASKPQTLHTAPLVLLILSTTATTISCSSNDLEYASWHLHVVVVPHAVVEYSQLWLEPYRPFPPSTTSSTKHPQTSYTSGNIQRGTNTIMQNTQWTKWMKHSDPCA